jgi:hypothetical protein
MNISIEFQQPEYFFLNQIMYFYPVLARKIFEKNFQARMLGFYIYKLPYNHFLNLLLFF